MPTREYSMDMNSGFDIFGMAIFVKLINSNLCDDTPKLEHMGSQVFKDSINERHSQARG